LRTVERLPLEAHLGEGTDRKPLQVFESERIAPSELARVLRLVQAGKLKVTDSTQRPTDGSTRLIGEALVAPEFDLEEPPERRGQWSSEAKAGPVRAHAWGVLVQQCGWAKPKSGALALTPAGQEVLQGFSPEPYREGVARFLTNGDFDELHRVNHIRGQTGRHKRWISNPGLRKIAVREVMATFPVGLWVKYAEALRLVQASGEDWNVMNGEGFLYICDAQYGLIYDHAGVNSQFLRALLMESLATLGVVDIAYVYPHHEWPDLRDNWGRDSHAFCGRYDGLRYVRLTALGAFCLRATDSYLPHTEDAPKLFRVLPNLEIAAVGEGVGPGDRLALDAYAVRVSDHVWRLETDRCLEIAQGGRSVAEIREFLSARNEGPLPTTVDRFLDDVERRCRRVRDRGLARLVECEDADLATLVAHDARTRGHCMRAGERHLVVPASSETAFRRGLREIGYLLADEEERVGRTPLR